MTTSQAEHVSSDWVPDDSTFGARLALVRQRMSWGNVKEAAVECGLPVESWRQWERDGAMPRRLVEVAQVIASRTGCSLAWLLTGTATIRERTSTRRDRRGKRADVPVAAHTRPPNRGAASSRPPGHPGGSRRPILLPQAVTSFG